ncbi:hypothetical protein DPMN_080855 [Dreissena polymorpha]|uniref:Uncharacterized protein n=1 Tax=Dreissena polymorpha TaxID=45954 RepID=A0A9D3Y3W4_DREPO|nr:hypothetical protein DPMN_080855 [Dreissena polymorpha]
MNNQNVCVEFCLALKRDVIAVLMIVRTVVALRTVLSAPFIHVVRIRREFRPLLRGRRIELRLKEALKHDTSFVVWSSTPFDSQPEVNQNSNSALNNIREASISAQLLSFR